MIRQLKVGLARASGFIVRFGLLDLALIAGALAVYSVVREVSAERVGEAFHNSFDIVRLEEALGISHERDLQDVTLSSVFVTKVFNAIYTYGHFPLMAAVGVFLFVFHRPKYAVYRNAVLVSGAIGLLVFNIFPMAPPRLMPAPYGLTDTLSLFQKVNYHSAGTFVNPYAAMPSMHITWNLLACLAFASAFAGPGGKAPALDRLRRLVRPRFVALGSRVLQMAAISFPLFMAIAVVVTGNHFILDIVAGYVVAAIGLGVAVVIRPEAGWRWDQQPEPAPETVRTS